MSSSTKGDELKKKKKMAPGAKKRDIKKRKSLKEKHQVSVGDDDRSEISVGNNDGDMSLARGKSQQSKG